MNADEHLKQMIGTLAFRVASLSAENDVLRAENEALRAKLPPEPEPAPEPKP